MDFALDARGFAPLEGALVETFEGVLSEGSAFSAKLTTAVMASAIQGYHGPDCLLLAGYATVLSGHYCDELIAAGLLSPADRNQP